ncbi:AAA family ATPase [Croceicoccus sp. YJ47]|uniref:AAA family ATPase n=1 Tax=Croceicoccus sp. YJ47 TaxID=2798724 RepID=UPI001922270D|nr:AAA family ATPase [Croceicoccus sp. YJ47]QQN74830.1 AAA family ATPase [Croceicoccus sp. YJ47]
MTDLRTIASVMGGEVKGNRACFPTPGHSKTDRGSWASLADSAPDGVLIHSTNGGDPLAIKDQLRAAGVLPPRLSENDNIPWHPPIAKAEVARDHAVRLGNGQRIVATFEFADGDGETIYRKHRIEPGRDGRAKEFAFDHLNASGGWVSGRGDDAVPYRLPDLVTAHRDLPIYMAEGEAKADKLASWGLLATSHKDWKSFEFSGYVKGRTVYILPDNDETGAREAVKAKEAIERAEGTAHIIELPGLPPKGDILDWAGTPDDLSKLIDNAIAGDDDWPALDLAACANEKAPARQWVIDGWVPANKATLLAGDGGVGKSLLAQIKATCVAFGRPFMGLKTKQANAAYVSWEDDADELWRRQESICEVLGIPMSSLSGRLSLVSYTEEENPFLVTADDSGLRVTPLGRKVERLVERHNVGLLILDNASQIAGIDHNAVEEVAPFAHWLGTLATRRNGAVVLLHHTNKAGQDYLGSVSYNNQFRSRMLLARPEDCENPDLRALTNPKANYAQAGSGITLQWFDGAFILEKEVPDDTRAEMAEVIKLNGENEAFLRCLRARMKTEGREVGPSIGPNYAPARFAEMTEAKGLRKPALARAMERLFHMGAITTEQVKRKGNDTKTIIVEAIPDASEPASEPLPNTTSEPIRTPFRTVPNTHPIYKYIPGAGPDGPRPPDEDDPYNVLNDPDGWVGECPAEHAARLERAKR